MRVGALAGHDWSRDAPARLLASRVDWRWLAENVAETLAERAAWVDAKKPPNSASMVLWLSGAGYDWTPNRARRYFSAAIDASRSKVDLIKYHDATLRGLRSILSVCPDVDKLDMGQGAFWSWAGLRPDLAQACIDAGAELSALPDMRSSLNDAWSKNDEQTHLLPKPSDDRRSQAMAAAVAAWERAVLQSGFRLQAGEAEGHRGPRL
jgi:hypothetical protein